MAETPDTSFTATDEDLLPILHELQSREPIFHRPATTPSFDDLGNLMAPGYWEVGASGRRYSRAFIATHLAQSPPLDADATGWQTTGFACQRLGPDTFLLTYSLHQEARKTRRATVWRRSSDRWQILYHQGTVVTADEDNIAPPNAS